jgi:hypothetical protein
MKIRQFEDSDWPTISSWYASRNLPPPNAEWLPEIGFVVDNVAAGFVYNAEGKLALLEGYITNPASEAYVREKALDLLTATLIEAVRCPRIYAVTTNPAIVRRASRLGFNVRIDRTFLSKEIY